jgi:hypothetical protein
MRRLIAGASGLLALLAPSALGAPAGASQSVTFEVFSPTGAISRVGVPADVLPDQPATAQELSAADVTPLHVSGPSANRYDIVIVGDGYTAAEQGLFAQHALDKWQTIRTTEPFATYVDYFNVWMVTVASNESGVDADPYPGIMRDTALDMQFWCSGTERLLCMNNTKATAFANLAPGSEQVLGLANSTKYGGAGGAYATSSGGNAAAAQITVHELGHSIGGLADEYEYYYRAGLHEDAQQDVQVVQPLYTGGEPSQVNLSTQQSPAMLSGQTKWWRWMGEPTPDGGVIGTFEGGGYYKLGIYRPSENSLMRSLYPFGKPLNLPSREKMTQAFYTHVKPIDAAPPAGVPLDGGSPVTIEVLQPSDHDLTIDWYLDGVLVEDAHNETTFTFDPEDTEPHAELRVRVVDETPFVRNPTWIANNLTQQLTWTIAA